MGLFNWFWPKTEKRYISNNDGVNSGITMPRTLAGVYVDEQAALSITAVWCAVSTISNLVAGLPLNIYQHLSNGGKREAKEHPLYELLHDSPCPEMSKESFWQTSMAHVLLHGNSYAEIERDESGRPVALWLLPPQSVEPFRDEELGLTYKVKVGGNQDVFLPACNVFHVAGLSPDGVTGYSPIRLGRESLALTKAAENFGSAFFGNSARPAGVLQSALKLSPQARENLRKSWEALYSGSTNTGRTAVLEEGLTWQSISIPPEDAQYIELRGYQLAEIARIFSIPLPFLQDLSRATWANLETLNRQLVQLTLMPWLQKIEAQVRMKLFSQEERRTYFAEHDVTGLLRADTLTRFQAYQIATGGKPWQLPSEVRAAERLDPVEGIDDVPGQGQELPDDGQGDDKEPQGGTDGTTGDSLSNATE